MSQQPARSKAPVQAGSTRTTKSVAGRTVTSPKTHTVPGAASSFGYPVKLVDGSTFFAKTWAQKEVLESAQTLIRTADAKIADEKKRKNKFWSLRR